MNYYKHYSEFLGIKAVLEKNKINIIETENRNQPICKYYYHLLIKTEYDGQSILSVSPQYSKYVSVLTDTSYKFEIPDKKIEKQKMIRMGILNNTNKCNLMKDVIQIKDKYLFSRTFGKNKPLSIIEQKWNQDRMLIQSGRVFAMIKNDEIISYSTVSDIFFGAGNIFVWTKEQFHGKGYGTAVASKTTEWCLDNNIMPVYLVNIKNMPSTKIAYKIGYTKFSDEDVYSLKQK